MWFVYAGNTYYPLRGMGDFVGSFLTEEEAESHASSLEEKYDWVEVINIEYYICKG